jgi:hypothetical protein
MRKCVPILAIAALLFAYVGNAQAVEGREQGNASVLIGIEALSDITAMGISGPNSFGLRYFVQDGMSVSGIATVGIGSSKDESQTTGVSDDKTTTTDLGLSLALEKWRDVLHEKIGAYMGVGAGFELNKTKHELPVASSPPAGTLTKTTTTGTSFSASLNLGFLYQITGGLHLGAASSLGFSAGSDKSEADRQGMATETTSKTTSFDFGFNTMDFYLSWSFM